MVKNIIYLLRDLEEINPGQTPQTVVLVLVAVVVARVVLLLLFK